MIKALAPGMPRGCSWVWLSIVLIGALPFAVQAQPPKPTDPGKAAAKPADDADKAPADKAKMDDDDDDDDELSKLGPLEVFKDDNAEKALANTFPQVHSNERSLDRIRKEVDAMANGSANVDSDVIKRFVNKVAADLTDHGNIKSLIDPPIQGKAGSGSAGSKIRDASAALMKPLELAHKTNNEGFLATYNRELIASLPKLLDYHLFSRLEAIIALAQTGSPDALDIFVKQLNNEKQTVWVKLWAARGITNIVQSPTGNHAEKLVGRADAAARALVKFLNTENLPWPAQVRVLETLGALRQAGTTTAQSRAEMAEAVVHVLADPKAKIEVRAWAAWTLGMMQIGAQINGFNYPLAGYLIGEVAADLGDLVVQTMPENPKRAQYYTGLLVYQIYPALFGQLGYRESGLLKQPSVTAASRAFLTSVGDQVKAISAASVELTTRAVKSQRKNLTEELAGKVAALKATVEKNPPAEKRLVPDGQEVPLAASASKGRAVKAALVGRP
jgi:hypothetical protein